jgi:anti-anti-sigma factor
MEINDTRAGDFLILEPVGHLDTRTSNELENKIAQHLAAGQKRFIIDLVATEYISSAGLRVLLMLAKKSDGGERELILCSLNASVREVFEIAGFHNIFTIVESRSDAVARGSSRPQADRIFHIAARLMAIRRSSGEEEQINDAGGRAVRRAAELLAIAEERDLRVDAESGVR